MSETPTKEVIIMKVVIVERHQTDSWNSPPPTLMCVASDEEAAKRWIDEETKGNHHSGHTYMQGKNADWWIKLGHFSLTSVKVQE